MKITIEKLINKSTKFMHYTFIDFFNVLYSYVFIITMKYDAFKIIMKFLSFIFVVFWPNLRMTLYILYSIYRMSFWTLSTWVVKKYYIITLAN